MVGGSGFVFKFFNVVSCTIFRDNGNGKLKKVEIRFLDVYGSGVWGLSEERYIVSFIRDRF